MRKPIFCLIAFIVLTGLSTSALANEFTDVIDAFDDENDDPFDINVSAGYERVYRSSTIRRETIEGDSHKWDYFNYIDMMEYFQTTHLLNLNLEVGLFKDLSFRMHLPVILNDSRRLDALDTLEWDDIDGDGDGDQIIQTPFKSPERSGVDYMAFGLWWGILDQGRDDTKPNWTVFAEGRFAVGDELQAACASADVCDNQNGGISRGINEFRFGTRLSRRYGLVDPYFGFDAKVGWPKDGTAFKLAGSTVSQINDMPPVVGFLDFGVEFIPWEQPDRFRKLVIGVGGGGAYHSEGQDYTPFFDALGAPGDNQFFDSSNYDFVDFNENGTDDGGDESKAAGEWTGVTDVENFASFFGKLYVMIEPAKYVKFRVSTMIGHETEHFITKTDECSMGNLEEGICTDYNLGHRPEVDKPGRRFRAEGTLLWVFALDVTAQF